MTMMKPMTAKVVMREVNEGDDDEADENIADDECDEDEAYEN